MKKSHGYSSSLDIQMEQEYLYQAYPYLRKENSPVYGAAGPEEVVLKPLSYDELCYLLSAEGTYLILFGGPWCKNTAAVIDRINFYARKHGVDTVYQFDFRTDSKRRRGSIREDITAQSSYDGPNRSEIPVAGAEFNYLYGELVSRFLTNLDDWTEHTSGSGNAIRYLDVNEDIQTVPKLQMPFLFLYNKDNRTDHSKNACCGEPGEDKTYPIVYAMEKMYFRDEEDGKLYSDKELHDETTLVEDYDEQLETAIFSHIGENGLSLASYTHADYIRDAYRMNTRGHSFKTENAFSEDEPINLQMVTLGELNWILDQEGTFLILFGGAWCANTQAAVATINDYAVANHVRVYMFDFRIDGKYPIDFWGYPRSRELQIRSDRSPLKQFYVEMLEQHFGNVVTVSESKWDSPIIEYVDEEGKKHSVGRMQAPYFMAYDRDAVDGTGKPAQILAYCEKMYELINCKETFIYSAPNYADYKAGVFDVIRTYCRETGAEPVEITKDRTAPIVEGEPVKHQETVAHHREHDWTAELSGGQFEDECCC